MGLKTSAIVRMTRGSYRGDPHYKFGVRWSHDIVKSLLTTDFCASVHREFTNWIEDQLRSAECANNGDQVEWAQLQLLHHDLDAKLEFHRGCSNAPPLEAIQSKALCQGYANMK